MTIKEIAMELLKKYEEAKTTVIWEYSGNIDGDIKKLKKEIGRYKKEINQSTD